MNAKSVIEVHPDAQLIDQLGGPAVVARALGFDMPGGVQRVHNWKSRGIPPLTRITRTDVFGPMPANDSSPNGVAA
ncbi:MULTISPECIES: hypothetical protein [Stenotrophomonas]|uniref:hypothetical protein n=1 Tax=Stenotrophomonas TaxID=40323 RepID=UPI000871C891|nr:MULTISPECIES: hypothetical protein [Stenotrophomonas]OEZ02293.1 hypothetical protein BIY45_01830 [Stenotrophomonas sp. BIIR7]